MSHVSGDTTATTGIQEVREDIGALFIGFMAGDVWNRNEFLPLLYKRKRPMVMVRNFQTQCQTRSFPRTIVFLMNSVS